MASCSKDAATAGSVAPWRTFTALFTGWSFSQINDPETTATKLATDDVRLPGVSDEGLADDDAVDLERGVRRCEPLPRGWLAGILTVRLCATFSVAERGGRKAATEWLTTRAGEAELS